MDISLVASLSLLGAAIVAGIVYKALHGRGHKVRKQELIDLSKLRATQNGVPVTGLGKLATLVQFTTEYCGQCPGVRRTLSQLAFRHGGLEFCEVDITDRLDVAAHFNISQTPTVFLLDGSGKLVYRVGGIPKLNLLAEELEKLGVK